jgi:hypothetical protein
MDHHIRKTLRELQAQLRHTESLPESEREFVDELYEEIEELLSQPKETLTVEHHKPLLKRLDDAAHRFEVTHPDLTGVIGRVVDSLSTMGI